LEENKDFFNVNSVTIRYIIGYITFRTTGFPALTLDHCGEDMIKPVGDIRVLDLSRALAGPYCTMMLGDLGADVIKVELPGKGDESRGWGPPFVGEPNESYPGESTYYLSINRNKRSLTVNLKSQEGQEIIKRLASVSDVFIENFRTGTLDRIGLGYEHLKPLNSRLVYCSITGYGRTGPLAEQPGYDFIIQAEGGIMGLTGPVEGPPYRVGVSIIDITTGIYAATAILAALRAREFTGEGQLLDLSLLDTAVSLLANMASNYLIGGIEPQRMGNAHFNIAPYEVFRARDRYLVLGALNARQWELLCQVAGTPELKDDPRFSTNQQRVTNRVSLVEVMNDAFSTRDAHDWLALLQEAGLACGVINSIKDVFDMPQTQARQLRIETEHPTAGMVAFPGFAYKMSQTPPEVHRPPPLLGEHTAEILEGVLGYSTGQISTLQERGVI
jgi:crotonobetainyl-CoA:carnitine CoA-transferase CaiB-like acyl-CoA transferase